MGLSELIAKYDVPGAQVAVLTGGEIRDEAAGASSDSVFRVGSITKLWTATFVQRLVDMGGIDSNHFCGMLYRAGVVSHSRVTKGHRAFLCVVPEV